jgi:hypothetical protein
VFGERKNSGADSPRSAFASCCGHNGRHPRLIVTDKLRSYAAAKRVVMPGVAHRQHRYLSNRAENAHQPTRERERHMRQFKSAGPAQRFVEVHGISAPISNPDVIFSLLLNTDESEANDFESGMKSRRRLPLRERCRVCGFSRDDTIRHGPLHETTRQCRRGAWVRFDPACLAVRDPREPSALRTAEPALGPYSCWISRRVHWKHGAFRTNRS